MTVQFPLLVVCFFLIAMTYASVGFGGGSSYLALMAVVNVPVDTLRPVALLCNIVVVTGGVIIFAKEGKLDLRKGWLFLAAGIPFAFLGGHWKIDDRWFFTVLGISLIVASGLLWLRSEALKKKKSSSVSLNLALGGGIGFLSGLVSIGGGIFLSPLLHLIDWDEAKKISAMASLFILGNSISGLAGQWLRAGTLNWALALPLLLAVLVGGQIGSRLGTRRFDPTIIKRITAVLILVAGINILRTNLF